MAREIRTFFKGLASFSDTQQDQILHALKLICSMLGIDVCALALVSPDALPCPTLGCTLTQGIFESTVLWWIGLAAFAFIGLCEWSKKRKLCPKILAFVLLLDCPLLVLMIIGTPCVPCLIIATLFLILYLLYTYKIPRRTYEKIIVCVWSIVYIACMGLLINDTIKPCPLVKIESPIARIYFSPSCSACKRLVLGTHQEDIARIEWCPVAESSDDIPRIATMYDILNKGGSLQNALSSIRNTNAENQHKSSSLTYIFSHIHLYLRLWINASHALSGGRNALPFIESYGVRYALKRYAHPKQHTSDENNLNVIEPQINECTHTSADCREPD